MALPTTEAGPVPQMGQAAWALPTPAPSGQQHVDFAIAIAAAAPLGHQLVADFPGQQQMHPQRLQRQQQQQQQPHHSQPQLQRQFGLYAQYYNPGQQQYGFVSTSQARIECQSYQPPRVGQPPGSAPGKVQLAPPLSQPQQPAPYTQSLTSNDIPVFLKQKRSSSSPHVSSTPPHPPAPAGFRHPERPSVDAISALPTQVEAVTTVTMVNNPKLPSAASMHKTRSASSPKAGMKRSRKEAGVGIDDDGSAEPEEQKKRRRPRVKGGCESRGERRRQQVRDAQRAYRNRIDNRIVELEEQVERLEREKVDMSRDFGSVLDLLRGQGNAQTSAVIAQCFDDLCRKYPLGTLDYHDGDAQGAVYSAVRDNSVLVPNLMQCITVGQIEPAGSNGPKHCMINRRSGEQ